MKIKTPKLTLIKGGKKEFNRFRVPSIIILILIVGTIFFSTMRI